LGYWLFYIFKWLYSSLATAEIPKSTKSVALIKILVIIGGIGYLNAPLLHFQLGRRV